MTWVFLHRSTWRLRLLEVPLNPINTHRERVNQVEALGVCLANTGVKTPVMAKRVDNRPSCVDLASACFRPAVHECM